MKMTIEPKLTKLPGGNWRAWNKANGILVHAPTREKALLQFEMRARGRFTPEAEIEAFNRGGQL